MERAIRDGLVLPVVLVKVDEATIRSPLTEETEVQVLMDLVTVLPHPTPVAYVLTVLFDDVADPFYYLHLLHPVPPTTIHAVPILRGEASINRQRARRMLLDFCQPSPACGVIVMDVSHRVLFHRIVAVSHGPLTDVGERNSEIREVIEFLDGFELQRDVRDLTAVSKALFSSFWVPIRCPDGVYRPVPPGRSVLRTREAVFSIRLRHGRLVDRAASDQLTPDSFVHDVFISHAHTDGLAAEAIRHWIQRLFPSLRLRMTDTGSDEQFMENPRFFILDSVRSASLLFVATQNSLHRPMVQLELSHNAHKPIVTAVAGEVSRQDVEREMRTNPFIALDADRIVDLHEESGWGQLAALLAGHFGLEIRGQIAPVPDLAIAPDSRTSSQRWADYLKDWTTISRAFLSAQSRADAEKLVGEELERLHAAGQVDAPGEDFDPETKLLMLLDVTQRTLVPMILDCFPALVNDYLVRLALEVARQCEDASEAEGAERMRYIAGCARGRLGAGTADASLRPG